MSKQPYTLTEPDKLALVLLSVLKPNYEGISKTAVFMYFTKEVQDSFDKLENDGLISREKRDFIGVFYVISEDGEEVLRENGIKVVKPVI